MIHAVLFDFGNVVCTFDLQRFLWSISRYSRKSLAEIQRLAESFRDIAMEYESGMISSDRFFDDVRRRAELSITKKEFIKAYCEIFSPIPRTLELIRKLKPNYTLGLVSNTNEWHFEYGIRPVEVFPLFDAVTLSYQVKALKPARAVYDDILTKLMVYPPECAYIDDLQENVDAAMDIGMHAIHYTSPDLLEQSLRSLGVTF
jgi:FMN phosphatase YigB (HAD superfamily)